MKISGIGLHQLFGSWVPPTRRLRRLLLGAMSIAALATALTAATASAASAAVIGPEVSSHNQDAGGTVDWTVVHGAGGASFAFVKATEGGTYLNPSFASDFASIHKAGMIRGAYHYARPSGGTNAEITADATAEASFFIRTTGPLTAKGDLPPALAI